MQDIAKAWLSTRRGRIEAYLSAPRRSEPWSSRRAIVWLDAVLQRSRLRAAIKNNDQTRDHSSSGEGKGARPVIALHFSDATRFAKRAATIGEAVFKNACK